MLFSFSAQAVTYRLLPVFCMSNEEFEIAQLQTKEKLEFFGLMDKDPNVLVEVYRSELPNKSSFTIVLNNADLKTRCLVIAGEEFYPVWYFSENNLPAH